MFLILMLVAGQVLVILEVSGDQQNREKRNTYVKKLILDAYKQEEVEALTEFIIDSVSFQNFLKKNTHESSTWTNILTGSFKTFQESVFAYCKGFIELNRIPHLILAINAFIDYWPNREISSAKDTRELKQPSKYTKEGFSKPDYQLKLMEFIRSPKCSLSFVNDEFVGKIQSNGMANTIKDAIDNRISIAIQNNLNYKDERIFYDKFFRAIDDGDFQDALLAYEDWLEDTRLNYKEIVEYLSEAKFGAVESSLEFEEKTLQKLENLRKLLGESRQVAEMRVLSQILVQSKVFSELIENKDLDEFLNDAEASGKFRLYLHQYICNSPFLLGNKNMIHLVNAFVTYWLDLGYITVRFHVAEHKKSYLEDIESFFEDKIATRNLKFVNDDFILKFKRDINFRFNIEDAIKNRVEVVYWNKYNSDDERHFYEKLFEMIDRGLFNNDIKKFLAWKTDNITKMRTLNLHISHMKQDIIDCEEDKLINDNIEN